MDIADTSQIRHVLIDPAVNAERVILADLSHNVPVLCSTFNAHRLKEGKVIWSSNIEYINQLMVTSAARHNFKEQAYDELREAPTARLLTDSP
jgi:hypothetical protein